MLDFNKNKNIIILAISYFLLQLQFWFPIWVIFLLDRGFSLQQIVVADIIYWAAIVVLEFPMGVLSDKIGRRTIYLLAAFFGSAAYFMMLLIQEFWMLVLSWLFWAIYISAISGTDNAYIYELTIEVGLKERARYIFGYFTAIRYFAILISTLFAGFLYVINMDLPILLNSIFAFVSGLTILLLPKTSQIITHQPKGVINQVWDNIKHNKIVKNYIVFSALLYIFTWTSTLLFQPLLLSINISLELFGIIFAFFTIFGIIGGYFSGLMVDLIGEKLHIILNSIFIILATIFIGILPDNYSIIGIILLNFNYALIYPVIIEKINSEIDNESRASILSFANLIVSLGLLISRPLLVYLAEKFSIKQAYFIWGIIGILLLSMSLKVVQTINVK